MSRWSSLCAGRAELFASYWARSTELTSPLVPGGSTSRKPGKPLKPYGCGVGAAAAGAAATASRAIPAATMVLTRSTMLLPSQSASGRARYRFAERLCAGSRVLTLVVQFGADPEFMERVIGGVQRRAVAHGASQHRGRGDRGPRLDVHGE